MWFSAIKYSEGVEIHGLTKTLGKFLTLDLKI